MSVANHKRIGFVGAGMMGSGMAACLIRAGFQVTVIAHRSRNRIEALLKQGAYEARTFADLSSGSDVVIMCLNSAEVVAEVVARMKPGLRPGMLILDATTSRPETSRQIAAEVSQEGIAFVDAPVVGGPAQAVAGRLGTCIGGSEEDVALAHPILSSYSVEVQHFGPVGSGNEAKLLNNFLTVGLRQLVVQAFRAARRHNIDWAKLYSLASKGAANSRTLEQIAMGAIEGDYQRNMFSISNCHKDITYVAPLLRGDRDGDAIRAAIEHAYLRLVDAGFGDLLAGEMLSPDIERSLLESSS